MFGKSLHFLIYIEVKGVLSAMVWGGAPTVMASVSFSSRWCGMKTHETSFQNPESQQQRCVMVSLLLNPALSSSTRRHFCFREKRKLRRLGRRKQLFCTCRFLCGWKETFRSRSVWNISYSSAGAAGIKDSCGYIWWERSTPLLSRIRRWD